MNIAMFGQQPNPLFVSVVQSFFRGDFADATEPQCGKPILQRVEQRDGIVTGDCEQ